jgi:hypothetical protein
VTKLEDLTVMMLSEMLLVRKHKFYTQHPQHGEGEHNGQWAGGAGEPEPAAGEESVEKIRQ